jgi:hypothetical protein
MRPVPGRSGLFQSAGLGSTRGPLVARREGHAWIVVAGNGPRVGRQLGLVGHLHARLP